MTTNIYVFRSCFDTSIDDVSKCAFVIAEDRERFVLHVVILFSVFAKLQQPSSFSRGF